MNILIVDDHPLGRRLLRAILENERLNVFEAGDGIEALATLEHDRIDAVITDILMPRMDGFQLCFEMRARERTRETPILMYSATYTAAEDEQRAFELGADRFLKKPAPPGVIVAAVRECVAHSTPHAVPEEKNTEFTLMRNYSERLVTKLEERNLQLEEAHAQLREAQALLEWRVRQRTAELTAANQHLELLADFVAREVRDPLRTVDLSARRLREEFAAQLPAAADQLTAGIADVAGHTGQLAEALLMYCRVGAQPVRRRPVNTNEVVSAALAALADEWRQRLGEILVQPLPPCAADPSLLELVFRHLIANALKFTARCQAPQIEIGALSAGDQPEFYVRDNGVGFDARYAEQVFEPFLHLHREEGYPGAGLGLSLVRNIVQRHGGTIRVEAAAGRGATFFFSLERVAPGAILPPLTSVVV